jgi:pimeloyl-ACP methyl ester carboxylesterase
VTSIEGPLFWEQRGSRGAPMVFIHPNPFDRSCWTYQTAHFSTWFRTIAVDLPGYGRSPRARPGLTMGEVARACWRAVSDVSDEPAIVVGLSVGSTVGQFMAALEPRRTRALVLTGGGYFATRDLSHRIRQHEERGLQDRRAYALEMFAPMFRETPVAAYFADMLVERERWADARSIAELFRALERPLPDGLLASIEAPTLIVTGDLDPGHQLQFELQRRIPGAELSVIPGAGHICNIERPWDYDRLVLEFLERHDMVPRASRAVT